ncbi:helix-turn-helix domain-containing protein [Senegalia massiliensis]|nr:helix-turn-helix transcriptional regulator [Senegalia massiliensis]
MEDLIFSSVITILSGIIPLVIIKILYKQFNLTTVIYGYEIKLVPFILISLLSIVYILLPMFNTIEKELIYGITLLGLTFLSLDLTLLSKDIRFKLFLMYLIGFTYLKIAYLKQTKVGNFDNPLSFFAPMVIILSIISVTYYNIKFRSKKVKTIGNRLKLLREGNCLTHKELSTELDISVLNLILYENERKAPTYNILKKIAIYFDVSPDYLNGNFSRR